MLRKHAGQQPVRRDSFYAPAVLAFSLILACLWTPGALSGSSVRQPTIAIIIDDMGNSYQNGLDVINMPYPLTLAFLPERQHTASLSKKAHERNKEIILHAPMENILGLGLGAGALTSGMSEMEIKHSLLASLGKIPYAVGVNNHMGSKLTADTQAMRWVMEQLREYPIYFVDSRTSPLSVAAKTANHYQIPHLSRDVFLDHQQTRQFVQQQFIKLLKLARKNGTAVAIGHPHRVTIDYLDWALPKLDERGFRIATVSSLWQIKHPRQTMFANRKGPQGKLALASPYQSGKGTETTSPHHP